MLIFHYGHKMTSKLSHVCVRSGQTILQKPVSKLPNITKKWRLHIPDTADGDIFGCSLFV